MPFTDRSFVILGQVDSTNNYAMAKVHAGMAKHGDACFTSWQTAGKGQRGKEWQTGKGLNIALSIILQPTILKINEPFPLSAAIALASLTFFKFYGGKETTIKWPNDIYWRDRKAAGILIENVFQGKEWLWSVVGIGININQTKFEKEGANPVSLKQITGKSFDLVMLAKHLCQCILEKAETLLTNPFNDLMNEYNSNLYKKEKLVRLRKNNILFETLIKEVSLTGQLITVDATERQFDFGEVEWVG